jgi:hypothetical protein
MKRAITVLTVAALMAVMLVAGTGGMASAQGTDNVGIPGCENQKNRSVISGENNTTQQGTGVGFSQGDECTVSPNQF